MCWLKRSRPTPDGPASDAIGPGRFLTILLPFLFLILSYLPAFSADFVFPKDFPEELRRQHKNAFTHTEILDFWYNAVQYFNNQGDFLNAINASVELKDYAIRFRQPRFEAGAYEGMGQAYDYLGQLSKAVDFHLRALRIRERLGRKIPIAFSLSQMGDIYSQLKSYKKAEDYFQKSLQIFRSEGYQFEAAEVEYNLGVLFRDQGLYDRALKNHMLSLKGFMLVTDTISIGSAFSAIGTDFFYHNKFDSSLHYHLKALDFRLLSGNELEIALSYSDLCLAYTKTKDFKKAKYFAKSFDSSSCM